MRQMEKVEMMEAMTILAGTVALKVELKIAGNLSECFLNNLSLEY